MGEGEVKGKAYRMKGQPVLDLEAKGSRLSVENCVYGSVLGDAKWDRGGAR